MGTEAPGEPNTPPRGRGDPGAGRGDARSRGGRVSASAAPPGRVRTSHFLAQLQSPLFQGRAEIPTQQPPSASLLGGGGCAGGTPGPGGPPPRRASPPAAPAGATAPAASGRPDGRARGGGGGGANEDSGYGRGRAQTAFRASRRAAPSATPTPARPRTPKAEQATHRPFTAVPRFRMSSSKEMSAILHYRTG